MEDMLLAYLDEIGEPGAFVSKTPELDVEKVWRKVLLLRLVYN